MHATFGWAPAAPKRPDSAATRPAVRLDGGSLRSPPLGFAFNGAWVARGGARGHCKSGFGVRLVLGGSAGG
jgi:hypothetical protein